MTESTTQLINAFSALPADEKRSVIIELARISETDAGPLSAEELSQAGAAAFSLYDEEEDPNGNAETN